MEYVSEFLSIKLYGITVKQLCVSFSILLGALIIKRVVVNIVIKTLHKKAEQTKADWDDAFIKAIRPPLELAILLYGVWLAIQVFTLPKKPFNVQQFVETTGHVLILVLGMWFLLRLVDVISILLRKKAHDPEHWLDTSLAPLISTALRILVVITSSIIIAQNMGYSVSGLVASLGLGGAALALASKDTVANLFGSFMILVDKPFTIGDWIKGDGFEGVVEDIGFRSTRIRTFSKTVENIPNNLMANIKVENMDRRKDRGLNVRRIKMTIGVTYTTSADQMEKAVEAIRDILKNDIGVDPRMTTLVSFTNFGESSLDIFIYYFSNRADWIYYLGVRQRVNLKIMRKLEEMGIAVAFPSRSLYIESMPEGFGGGEANV
ncbi:Potassium efflux system KefA protein / Small-conductance mechanosensitive channel [hydrothermal vent metagenome]|uniref:Potassium efflux system KefA protein / Small-conductance mechanosensitive channel n=1 Tax=hydrothermal vent metagenome TaxID=652676 RepID=A0A3B1C8H7_9ZZZZ